jgi:hypothetical protein
LHHPEPRQKRDGEDLLIIHFSVRFQKGKHNKIPQNIALNTIKHSITHCTFSAALMVDLPETFGGKKGGSKGGLTGILSKLNNLNNPNNPYNNPNNHNNPNKPNNPNNP